MKKKIALVFCIALMSATGLYGQITKYNVNKIFYPAYHQEERHPITFPKVDGYFVLVCDFHTHTMFSDGLVWPEYRVAEAWCDGLDALAITDHIEYLPYKKYLNSDHNTSYEIAKPAADKLGFMLVRAAEITRKQAVFGHFNALFIKDANAIALEDPKASIQEAKNQGAFVVWNHPGWAVDSTYFKEFQEDLLKNKLFDGIEVYNSAEFYPRALSWAIDKNLTVLATSDVHGTIDDKMLANECAKRPATLVLAKERSLDGIKEALFAGRTLAFFHNSIAGKESLAHEFVKACIIPEKVWSNDKNATWLLKNEGDIIFNFTVGKNTYLLPAKSTITISLPVLSKSITLKFNNIFIYENTTLAHDLQLN